ncbi:bifunctional 5,10-methylenetetrahydrofolate dehydrogenase/5,10-methenyltetrahydrofolate cyclohydrolase [Alicyclobacillaceae bacterium I2511]|nr:bifunctional 5,10-methylenetetrahydrofolate dehydrogenase/5,10-methenyltetrahydrofolate cyclohydrolase [Alicyclobacillaceae bacterium I2511]
MTHQLVGKPVATTLYGQIRKAVQDWKFKGVAPKIVTLLVGSDPASATYAQSKSKTAHKLGIDFELLQLPADTSERQLIQAIEVLNRSPQVHGIMVELPLPVPLDASRVATAIRPDKDVDGLHPANQWANMMGTPGVYPATPQACLRLLHHYGYSLQGRRVTLIGSGRTVGLPLLHQLLQAQATVSVCHVATQDLKPYVEDAEIVISAAGKAHLLQPEWVRPETVLIDIGMSQDSQGRLCGDAHPAAAAKVHACTPTPGGVGPVTTAQLFANLLHAMSLQPADTLLPLHTYPTRAQLRYSPLIFTYS